MYINLQAKKTCRVHGRFLLTEPSPLRGVGDSDEDLKKFVFRSSRPKNIQKYTIGWVAQADTSSR